jgi:cell shape-determining protein MreC
VRDTRTGALLSTDRDSVKAYERRRREAQAQKDRINRLEHELSELKALMSKLIEER